MLYARQPKRIKQKSILARYERERARQAEKYHIFISQEIKYADYIEFTEENGREPISNQEIKEYHKFIDSVITISFFFNFTEVLKESLNN